MYPSVYPSEIQYRPGRIQSLDAQQEIALKQCWAALLKSWGYEISLSSDDISLPGSFVASSIVGSLPKSSLSSSSSQMSDSGSAASIPASSITSSSITSNSTSTKEKVKKAKGGWGLFSSKSRAPKRVSQGRKNMLTNGYREEYTFTNKPSDYTKHIYCNVHQLAYNEKNEPLEEDTSDDESTLDKESLWSVETFETARSSVTNQPQTTVRPKKAYSTRPLKGCSSVHPALSKSKPRVVHAGLFNMVKNGLLDNTVLRFCRARKFSLDQTLQMLTHSVVWKQTEYPADEWLNEGDAPSYISGKNKGFIKNFTTEKSFIRGRDRNGNPLFVFQSSKHFAQDSPLAETERFATVVIEWGRLFAREIHDSVDAFTIIFDLTGFSLKNADNAPIKFLAMMFEAHYPETLGFIVVHNAPWIFSTVWNVIKNWLDPVVVSKIHFTKGYEELVNLIDAENIPSYLGGDDTDKVPYPIPTINDTRPPKRKGRRYRRLRQQRDELMMRFIDVTRKWCESTNPDVSSSYLRDKILINYQLSDNYIELDPYIRNPGMYDRNGTLVLRN